MSSERRGFVFVLMFVGVTCLRSVSSSPTEQASRSQVDPTEQGLYSGLKVLYRTYEQCDEQDDVYSCLKLKALKFADRALKIKSFQLIDGLSLVKKDDGVGGRQMQEPATVDETKLPQESDKKNEVLNAFLFDRVSRFLRSFTLQFSMPKFVSEMEDFLKGDEATEEGKLNTH